MIWACSLGDTLLHPAGNPRHSRCSHTSHSSQAIMGRVHRSQSKSEVLSWRHPQRHRTSHAAGSSRCAYVSCCISDCWRRLDSRFSLLSRGCISCSIAAKYLPLCLARMCRPLFEWYISSMPRVFMRAQTVSLRRVSEAHGGGLSAAACGCVEFK